MNHELHFQDIRVGTIEQTDMKFPDFRGNIKWDDDFQSSDSTLAERLRVFIEFSKKESQRPEDEEPTPEEQEALSSEIAAFEDVFDSEEWCIVNLKDESRSPIMVPFFCHDDTLTWRPLMQH